MFLRASSFDCLSFRRPCKQKREKVNVVTLHRTACYYAGSLNDSGITVKECARYSGLKSQSANNTGSMRVGNRRPRPRTAVESKGVFDPWQRSLFVPPVSSANTKEKGPLLAGNRTVDETIRCDLDTITRNAPNLLILEMGPMVCATAAAMLNPSHYR